MLIAHVDELKKITRQNKPKLISGIKRYLYYHYDITDLMEKSYQKSLKHITNFRRTFSKDASENEQNENGGGGVMSFNKNRLVNIFKKVINKLPYKDDAPSLKFTSQNHHKDFKIMQKIEEIQKNTPFENMTLLELRKTDKTEIKDPEEFKTKQDSIFREECKTKTMSFVGEFHEFIGSLESNPESLKELAMLLTREVTKMYIYNQIVLKEYHLIRYINQYLYGEMMAQQMQCVVLKNELIDAGGGKWLIDPKELQQQIKRFDKENLSLQKENDTLKINIIDLNQRISVRHFWLDFY